MKKGEKVRFSFFFWWGDNNLVRHKYLQVLLLRVVREKENDLDGDDAVVSEVVSLPVRPLVWHSRP